MLTDGLKVDVPRDTKTGTRELIAPAVVRDHFDDLLEFMSESRALHSGAKRLFSDACDFVENAASCLICS